MIRLRLIWSLLLLSLGIGFALVPAVNPALAADQPPASVTETQRPALWELRRINPNARDRKAKSKPLAYVFGTVHALPRDIDWFRPHVARALDQSKLLVLETTVPDSSDALLPLMMELSRLPRTVPLDSRVPEEWREALSEAAGRLKPGALGQTKTWAIALILANLQAQENGLDPRYGVEAVLAARARMHKISIEGLETAAEQLRNFDVLPETDQQALLVATLADLPQSEERIQAVLDDWLAGRADQLIQRIHAEFRHSPTLQKLLLDDRNARWAAWIAERLNDPGRMEGPLFIAVGAGHLGSDNGLLTFLRQYGFETRRVPTDEK